MIVKCFCCGKEFNKKITEIKKCLHSFCSRQCYDKTYGRTKVTMICLGCGNSFESSEAKVKKGRKFCSISCAARFNNTKYPKRSILKKCKICGVSVPSGRKYCKEHFYGHRQHLIGVSQNDKLAPESHGCLNCGKPTKKYFCSGQCHCDFRWKCRKQEIEENGSVYFGKAEEHNRRIAKKYLLEVRGIKCEICGLTHWMGKDIPLIIDHIDGDSDNNNLINLRLVCGNCNMQLPTFTSKNRGKGRDFKRIGYHNKVKGKYAGVA